MKYIKLICFLALLFIIPFSHSMGLLSNKLTDTIFFEPNLERTYSHFFTTNCGFTQDYESYVRMREASSPDLTKYVTISPSYFRDIPHQSTIPFTVHLRLPDKIEEAGIHEIRPGIRETETWGGGTIGSRTGSEARIIIIVLYKHKFARWWFETQNANVNETATFKVRVQNFGEPRIEKAQAEIKIYDIENNFIKTIHTDSKSIDATEQVELYASFSTKGMLPAEYRAVAVLDYDGNITEKESSFLIGNLDVKILGYTKEFFENSTQRMNILINSRWNNRIENLYADVNILDERNRIIEGYSFRTPPDFLNAWASKEFTGYFDNFGLRKGNYSIDIIVYFDGQTKIERGSIEIIEAPKQYVGEEERTFMSFVTSSFFLISIIIALLIANIVWLLLRKKTK